MEKRPLQFEEPEAALALSTLVAFADDDPSEAEGVVMRKYYLHQTAEAVQKKLDEGGYLYPGDLNATEEFFLPVLREAPAPFRLRTIAVALELARADGRIDQDEMKLLNYYAGALGVSLAEAEAFAASDLRELDESRGYYDLPEVTPAAERIALSEEEAGIALCMMAAFADDDPSEAETGVVREYYSPSDAEGLKRRLEEAGREFPGDVASLKDSILETLGRLGRERQLRALAIARKAASADGRLDPAERQVIRGFCEELVIGEAELRNYFKTSVV